MTYIREAHLSDPENRQRRTRDLEAILSAQQRILFDEFAKQPRPGLIAFFVNEMSQYMEFGVSNAIVGIHTMGGEVLGTRGGARDWISGTADTAGMFPHYQIVVERARLELSPELAILFEVIRMHMENEEHEGIALLLTELSNLNVVDQSVFVDLFSDFLTQEWHPRADAWSKRISVRTFRFFEDYDDHPVLQAAMTEALRGGFTPPSGAELQQ